jgi:hypothetical protein
VRWQIAKQVIAAATPRFRRHANNGFNNLRHGFNPALTAMAINFATCHPIAAQSNRVTKMRPALAFLRRPISATGARKKRGHFG